MSVNISVLIVSHNSGTLLLECVQHVLAAPLPLEVIVADNASVDCSIEALEELAARDARLGIIRNGADLGFAGSNNAALARARGKYVLFLSPECILGAGVLERMFAVMEAHPDAGMAGCWPENSCEAISGDFMWVRRDILAQVGSFDATCFMPWEDLDLSLRVRAAGWNILSVADEGVLRFPGRPSRPRLVEWGKHLGTIRFLRRHFPRAYPALVYPAIALAIVAGFPARLVRPRGAATSLCADPAAWRGDCPQEVWVFGASSLVGRHLLPRLVAAGYCVRAFGRAPAAAGAIDSLRLTWHEFDFGAGAALPAAGRPDSVIHLAPLKLLPGQIEALAARGMKRLIGFSSTSRFTKRNSSHPKERNLAANLETAEQAVEETCGRLGVRWAIFRPTLIYSLGHDRNVSLLAGFIRHVGFFPLPGKGSGKRQPVHADDLARACISLLGLPQGWDHAYNLSGRQVLTYRAMVEAIFHKLGRTARVVSLPLAWWRGLLALARLLPAYRDINMEMIGRVNVDMCFDHDEAARSFGFSPRVFDL